MNKLIRSGVSCLIFAFPLATYADEAKTSIVEPESHIHDIQFGGSVDLNFRYEDFSEISKDKQGDISFNKFKLNMHGAINGIEFSAQYRWYPYQNVIHHAWAGYQISEASKIKGGITQAPFGILPYIDNSYWFGPLYYLGLEDDYDSGVSYSYALDSWNFQLGFFKNEEWGDSSKSERYSLDLVRSGTQQNEESNQFNIRTTYTIAQDSGFTTELGLSAMGGQIYNRTSNSNGDRWAGAAHLHGKYGKWTTAVQITRYEFNPDNPPGVSDQSIQLGGFAATYLIASKANAYTLNVARNINIDHGKLKDMSCYSDNTIVNGGNTVQNTQLHVLGCSFATGPLYTYVDINRAKNFLWIGGDSIGGQALEDGWQTMFNVNVGYYF